MLFHPEHNPVVILDPLPARGGTIWNLGRSELPLGIGCELIRSSIRLWLCYMCSDLTNGEALPVLCSVIKMKHSSRLLISILLQNRAQANKKELL